MGSVLRFNRYMFLWAIMVAAVGGELVLILCGGALVGYSAAAGRLLLLPEWYTCLLARQQGTALAWGLGPLEGEHRCGVLPAGG